MLIGRMAENAGDISINNFTFFFCVAAISLCQPQGQMDFLCKAPNTEKAWAFRACPPNVICIIQPRGLLWEYPTFTNLISNVCIVVCSVCGTGDWLQINATLLKGILQDWKFSFSVEKENWPNTAAHLYLAFEEEED